MRFPFAAARNKSFWCPYQPLEYDAPEATDLLVLGTDDAHEDTVRVGRTRLRGGDMMIGPGVPAE